MDGRFARLRETRRVAAQSYFSGVWLVTAGFWSFDLVEGFAGGFLAGLRVLVWLRVDIFQEFGEGGWGSWQSASMAAMSRRKRVRDRQGGRLR